MCTIAYARVPPTFLPGLKIFNGSNICFTSLNKPDSANPTRKNNNSKPIPPPINLQLAANISDGAHGVYVDIVTGLNYHRARWLDPRIGQWTTEDPIGFDARDSNLRRYVSRK